jgi:iron-sulfur cluster repair protein YtfE (RIC family)
MHSQDWYTAEYAGDVVDHLVEQHDSVKTLMGRVLPTSGEARQRAFDEVREALARHEAAEEAVLRPLVREAPGGEEEAGQRTFEEDRAKEMLGTLERLDVDSIPFEVLFRDLEKAVLAHAEKEQTLEFPLLRQTHDPETLRRARAAVEDVEAGRTPPGEERQEEEREGTFAELLDRARRLFAHLTS